MKQIFVLFFMIILSSLSASAQSKLNLGFGYFGETLSYPGLVAEFDFEKFHTERFSTPYKANIGFYNHPRSHTAIFFDLHQGFRRYTKNQNWYFEQTIGLGMMLSFYNEDVWHVDQNGYATVVSNFANIDFMPSLTFGGGVNITPKKDNSNFIWLRPKIFWQLPFNNLALPHIAVQIGYTLTLKTLGDEK